MKNDNPVILAFLHSGDRQLTMDSTEFVSAVMRLHALHKYDQRDGEIELAFEDHIKILAKIEISGLRRMSLAACVKKSS
jgi:hypothetical protein